MFKIRVVSSVLVLTMVFLAGVLPASARPVKTNLYGLDGLFLATGGEAIPAGELVVGGAALVINDDFIDITSMPVTVTYGASSDVEIAAAFEVYRSIDNGVDDNGTGDLFFSVKYAAQEKTADYPATAVGLRIKLPLADDPLGTEETDFSLFAASQLDMKSVTGVLNVEYLMPGSNDPNMVNYVVGLEIPYSDTTDFTLELLDQPVTGDLFAAGATFDMGSSLNFGVALGFGLDADTAADFAAMGKLSFTF